MSKNTVKIGWMYPNLLNLHGERGSVQAFVRVGQRLGLDVQVQRISEPEEQIPFDELDILMFLPGELLTLSRLKPYLDKQLPQLRAFLNRGGHVIAVGTTGMLFGGRVQREDGSVFEGLGLLDMTATERKYVHGDDLHFTVPGVDHPILGCQIHMVTVDCKTPLGELKQGYGNNGTAAEGGRVQNLLYTNCLGPVFAKNPWWTEAILREITGTEAAPLTYPLEQASYETCCRFLAEKPAFRGNDGQTLIPT